MQKTIAAFTISHEKIMHAYKNTCNNGLKSMSKSMAKNTENETISCLCTFKHQ